jgi:hypothetical protein
MLTYSRKQKTTYSFLLVIIIYFSFESTSVRPSFIYILYIYIVPTYNALKLFKKHSVYWFLLLHRITDRVCFYFGIVKVPIYCRLLAKLALARPLFMESTYVK